MSARKQCRNETTRDEPDCSLAGPYRGAMEAQLEGLKEQLLVPLLSSVENSELIHELRWVANEAAALAWVTACPALVLPALLEEKITTALQRWERQQYLWKRHAPAGAAEKITSAPHHVKPAVMAA